MAEHCQCPLTPAGSGSGWCGDHVFVCCRRDPAAAGLPRSSSIDSLVEAVWVEGSLCGPAGVRRAASPLPQRSDRSDRSERSDRGAAGSASCGSPATVRRLKGERGLQGEPSCLAYQLQSCVHIA